MKRKIVKLARNILNIFIDIKCFFKSIKKVSPDKGDILIINIHGIGDIVMSTPVIAAAAEEFPGKKIDMLVQPSASVILENNSSLNRIYHFDEKKPLKSILQIKKKYDLVVLLIGGIWGSIAALLLRYNRITGMLKNYQLKLVYCGNGIKKREYLLENKDYFVNNLLEVISPVTGRKDYDSQFHMNPDLENTRNLADSSDNIAVISPETNWDLKNIKEKDLVSIAGLLKKAGMNVYVLGSRKPESDNSDLFVDLRGKTSLKEAIKLISQANLVVASDSAFMHIAAACSRPVFCVFGPTDPDKLLPLNGAGKWNKKLYCSPCYDGSGIPKCINSRYNACMELDDNFFFELSEYIAETVNE